MTEKLSKHTEFETKYRIDGSKIYEFKDLMEKQGKEFTFLYAEGPDHYYTKPDGSFLRYRKGRTDKGGRSEVTLKQKLPGAINNNIRKEVNWRVDKTDEGTIHEGAQMMGFTFNFKIFKMCHIYFFNDANIVFYTVQSDDKDLAHFVEIELDESKIHNLTEDQAWAIIRGYEAVLEPLGITYRNRLNKSLYEMYVKPQVLAVVQENVVALKPEATNG
jgi:adenylate cyclase class IV